MAEIIQVLGDKLFFFQSTGVENIFLVDKRTADQFPLVQMGN